MGKAWFNPDDHARDLVAASHCPQAQANADAWQEGMRQLEAAIAGRHDHAFETTLGGNSTPARLHDAAATRDVLMCFCGLDSPKRHLTRVRERATRGGHDTLEARVRERYQTSRLNLIALLPQLARLQVCDNSIDAVLGQPMPNPRLLLQMERGRIAWPSAVETLRSIPDWAKPIMEAALSMH